MSQKPDTEQDLAAAAQECSAVLAVAGRSGFRRGRSRLAELRVELRELDIESKVLRSSDDVTDFAMRALARKYRRVADLTLAAIFAPGRIM